MSFSVFSVVPNKIRTGQTVELVLTGASFQAPISVIINKTALAVRFNTGSMATVVLPTLAAGIYDINVINGDNSIWTVRQGITITDPSPSLGLGSLGAVNMPKTLAPILVDARPTAQISMSNNYRNLATPASVSVSGSTFTASKIQDVSEIASEPAIVPDSQSAPSTGKLLVTPFGTFKN